MSPTHLIFLKFFPLERMEITNLPQDLKIGIFMDLTPKQLLAYCLASTQIYKMCGNHDYVFRKYGLDIDMVPYSSSEANDDKLLDRAQLVESN